MLWEIRFLSGLQGYDNEAKIYIISVAVKWAIFRILVNQSLFFFIKVKKEIIFFYFIQK